jgi:phosphoglycerate dehydrogenase-like enzyme
MKILMYLPAATVNRCFHPRDLNRLQVQHEVVLPATKVEFPEFWTLNAPTSKAIVTGWGTPAITNEMLDLAPGLRYMCHSAGSVRQLLPPSFWLRDIRLATAHEALATSVAESTLALIISGLKSFTLCRALTRKGGWDYSKYAGHFPIRELYGMKIGIVGAGKVGRELVRLLRNFDVEILISDPHLSLTDTDRLRVQKVPLEELLKASDVVTLHAPALPETRHLLGAPELKLLRDGTIFINTARGILVDTKSLIGELQTGRIFAFIDVTDPEPPPADHPFRSLPNVVLLPHITGPMTNGCFRQGHLCVEQLLAFGNNTTVRGEVTREQAKIMA